MRLYFTEMEIKNYEEFEKIKRQLLFRYPIIEEKIKK